MPATGSILESISLWVWMITYFALQKSLHKELFVEKYITLTVSLFSILVSYSSVLFNNKSLHKRDWCPMLIVLCYNTLQTVSDSVIAKLVVKA